MLARRALIARLFAAGSLALLGYASPVAAAPPPASGGGGLPKGFDLKKQLQTGLKARRPIDFTYIDGIVTKVENGTLPRKLVDQAYLYARAQHTSAPIVYFQFTLKKLADKAGVAL